MDSLDELAQGPFTYRRARRLGLSADELGAAVRGGLLRRSLAGVYVVTSAPDTLEMRAKAASLVIPEHAVMCDRTAAWLHGVDVLAFWELDLVPPLETVVLPDFTRVRRAEALGGRRDLVPRDIVKVHGIRATSPVRTILDLGCKLRRRDAVAAADGLMRMHQLSRAELEAELSRFRGRRGVVQLREVLALADPRAESPGESWLRVCVIDAGLPVPEVQLWVSDDDGVAYRLDLGYSRLRIGLEFDGVEFHTSDDQRMHDEARRAWLKARGWEIIVVRKEDFTQARIDAWTSELGDVIRERRRVRGNIDVRRWRRDVSGVERRGPRAP